MNYDIQNIISNFPVTRLIGAYGNGHINDTFMCEGDDGQYILQRINSNVFKNPSEVMNNIENVINHLKKRIIADGGNPDRDTLTITYTKDKKSYYDDGNGNFFRMYKFVENAKSYDVADDPKILYHAGKAFGKFQNMLDDFPAENLYETIVDFHNTPKRVIQLEEAIKNNLSKRLDDVKAEVDFAIEYSKYKDIIVSAMEDGSVPLRVTHNDTKLNNVLFDEITNESISVIDLDTVMPGSMLYDFGDAMRFGAASGEEDEKDLNKIWFDTEKFEQFTKGFLEEMRKTITPKEIELLPISVLIMTYECGIRFLADHLNGDTYFKIHREGHNLDRARTQFKLVGDIEIKLDEMKKIVSQYV